MSTIEQTGSTERYKDLRVNQPAKHLIYSSGPDAREFNKMTTDVVSFQDNNLSEEQRLDYLVKDGIFVLFTESGNKYLLNPAFNFIVNGKTGQVFTVEGEAYALPDVRFGEPYVVEGPVGNIETTRVKSLIGIEYADIKWGLYNDKGNVTGETQRVTGESPLVWATEIDAIAKRALEGQVTVS